MKTSGNAPLRISYQLWGIETCKLFLIPLEDSPWALRDYWPDGLTPDAVEFIAKHCQCAYCHSDVSYPLSPCSCLESRDSDYVLEVVYKREMVGELFRKILDREEGKCKHRRRRAHLKRVGGSFNRAQLTAMLDIQKRMCYFCGVSLIDINGNVKFHADHYEPLSEGGANALENIVLTCARCNLVKGTTHGSDFESEAKKLRSAEAGIRLGQMRRQFNRWRATLLDSP